MAISQNFPEEGPTLNLNFAGSKTLDPHITFSRTSIGTYMDDSGLIVTAPTDSPRFDHSDVTGESLGLLVEEQRTNLIQNSVVSTANWTGTGQTPVSLSLNALGVFPGVRSISNGFNYHGIYHPNITLTSGTTYTATWYFRKGDVNPSNKFRAIIRDVPAAKVTTFEKSSASTDYGDINSYSFSESALATTNFEILSVDTLADGLTFKICTKFTASASSDYRFMFQTGSATVGETIISLGLQVEAGEFPTSYIPTSGSTVTRNHDRAYYENVDQTEWFNKTEGTVVFEHTDVPYSSSTSTGWPAVGFGETAGGGSNPSIQYFITKDYGAAQYLVRRFYPNGDSASISTGGTGSGAPASKVGFVYKADDYALVRNGSLVGIDTSGAVPDAYMLIFGMNGVTATDNNWNAHLKNLQYYPTRLSNTVLQNLTK